MLEHELGADGMLAWCGCPPPGGLLGDWGLDRRPCCQMVVSSATAAGPVRVFSLLPVRACGEVPGVESVVCVGSSWPAEAGQHLVWDAVVSPVYGPGVLPASMLTCDPAAANKVLEALRWLHVDGVWNVAVPDDAAARVRAFTSPLAAFRASRTMMGCPLYAAGPEGEAEEAPEAELALAGPPAAEPVQPFTADCADPVAELVNHGGWLVSRQLAWTAVRVVCDGRHFLKAYEVPGQPGTTVYMVTRDVCAGAVVQLPEGLSAEAALAGNPYLRDGGDEEVVVAATPLRPGIPVVRITTV